MFETFSIAKVMITESISGFTWSFDGFMNAAVLILCFFTALCSGALFYGMRRARFQLIAGIPSPPPDHILGHLNGMISHLLHEFRLDYAKKMPIYQLSILKQQGVFINGARDVYRIVNEVPSKGRIYEVFRYLKNIPDIFTSDKSAYSNRFDAFGKHLLDLHKREESIFDTFLNVLKKASESLEPFDASSYCTFLALDLIFKAVFHYDLGALMGSDEGRELCSALVVLEAKRKEREAFITDDALPISCTIEENAKRNLHEMLLKVLALVKSSISPLAMALKRWADHLTASEDSSRDMPQAGKDQLLIAELYQIISHGYSALSSQFQWILVSLHSHPRARMELERSLSRRAATDSTRSPVHSIYAECFLKEVLRRYPASGNSVVRTVDTDGFSIDGLEIPKGTPLYLHIFSLHNSEREWDNARSFLPERWMIGSCIAKDNGKINQQPPSCPFSAARATGGGDGSVYSGVGHSQGALSFFPFSAGERSCLGQHFAIKLLRRFICDVSANFRLEPVRRRPDIGSSGFLTISPLHESSTLLYVTRMSGLGRPYRQQPTMQPKQQGEEEKGTTELPSSISQLKM